MITRNRIVPAGFLSPLLSAVTTNQAAVYGFLMRAIQVVGGLAVIVLVARRLSPEIQGYYYTFASLTALQTFLELGFGLVIVQFASHEWARLTIDDNGSFAGDSEALSRLVSLARIAVPLYLVLSGVLIVVLVLAGQILFSKQGTTIAWKLPWLTVVIAAGLNLLLIPAWALMEGCNQIKDVYFYRATDQLVSNLVLCAAILMGAGLWAPAIASVSKFVYGLTYFYLRHPRFVRLFVSKPEASRINWRQEILPMQWRISLTWLSGSLLFTVFTPIAFHYQGPITAGRVGMTLNMTSALSTVALIWVSTTVPQMGMLIARRNFRELDRLFARNAVAAFATGVIGAIAILGLVYAMRVSSSFGDRVLPLGPTALFVLAALLLIASGPFGAYLRAHKREPLVGVSVFSSIAAGVSVWWFGSEYGPSGMAAAYAAVTAVSLVIVVLIWRRCRRLWHNQPEVLAV